MAQRIERYGLGLVADNKSPLIQYVDQALNISKSSIIESSRKVLADHSVERLSESLMLLLENE
jgi:hypothetical protein